MLACIDAENPLLPPEQRPEFGAKMRRTGVDWRMRLYGGTVHGFTNPEAERCTPPNAIRCSPEASARPWTALRLLFSEALGWRTDQPVCGLACIRPQEPECMGRPTTPNSATKEGADS